MSRYYPNHRLLAGLALLVLVVNVLPIAAAQRPAGGDKIERALLDELSADGAADFVVRFAAQADLAPAYQMGWQERGAFVVEQLTRTAGRSQAHAQDYLDTRRLRHRTFIAGNELYVWAGDLAAAYELAAMPEVSFIRATRTYAIDPIVETAPGTPASPEALAWGIVDAKADQFWAAFGMQGDGIVVANIDTGVQYDHPALDQAYRCPADPGNAACWLDPSDICPGDLPCDNNGHGSHTMGTMVADDDPTLEYQAGMAPNATWIACKGCETNSCSESALLACADWILAPGGSSANRPNVVNNSWGGGGCEDWYLAKVNAWRAAGIFPAFSAGNAGPGCATMGSPGDYQASFATAAHDSNRTIADFSSRGPSCYGHEPYTKPNLSAPGVSVCSTVPTDSWSCGYNGTSMASPHSAGAVALLWSCNPSLIGQIDQTFQILQDSADPPPAGNCGAPPDGQGNYTFGYGYLNVYQAGLSWCGAPGILNGHVLDASNGNPLNGAHVAAVRQGGGSYSTNTNASGFYQVNVLAGTYEATASAFGYLDQTIGGIVVGPGGVTTQDFLLTPAPQYTVSGHVTEAGSGSPLLAQVAILGTPVAPVWTDPGSGYYAVTLPQGTYTFYVTAAGHRAELRVVVVDTSQTQDFSLAAEPCVLLVDDDQDWPDVRVYYSEALEALGYGYDVWDLASQGNPGSADLAGYQVVIWFTGYPFSETFEPGDELALAAYLDGGGNLFLSSEDYLWEYGLTAFGENYLGIGSYTSDIEEIDVVGNAGNPVGNGLGPYALTAPPGWSGSLWTDYVSGASAPFRYQASGQNNATNHAGAGFKTVFLGWPFEGLPNLGDRAAVLGAILDWFGGCGSRGTLSGQVTHAYYATPIAGATVNAGPSSTVTGVSGRYTMTLPAGTYEVAAQKAGYTTQVVTNVVIDPGTTLVDLELSSPVAAVSPGSLHAYVIPNGQAVLNLALADPGEMDLSFSIVETTGLGDAPGTPPPLVAAVSVAGGDNTITNRWQDESLPCRACRSADIPWLSESPTAGTVPAGGGLDVAVTFSALAPYNVPGDYVAALVVDSNDPVAPQRTIPVVMTVFQPPAPPECAPPGAAAAGPAGPRPFGEDPQRGYFGTTDFQVVNLAPEDQPFTAHLLTPEGNEAYRFQATLPGGGSGVYVPGSALPQGFAGTVILETPVGAAMGIVHMEAPETGSNTVYPGVPDESLGTSAYTPIDDCTRLYVHNADATVAISAVLYVYDLSGEQRGVLGQEIPPLGLVAIDPVPAMGLPPDFVGSAVVAADRLIEVTVESHCGGLAAYVAPAYCGTTLYAPEVPGEETLPAEITISLMNPTDSWAFGSISYTYGITDMLYLPPRAGIVVPYPATVPTGPLVIDSNAPVVAVVHFTSYVPGQEGTFAYRALAAEEATRAVALPVLFKQPGGWQTGDNIWVMNVGPTTADVRIRYVAVPDGGVYWDRGTVPPGGVWRAPLPPDLPPGRAAALMLAEEGQSIIALAGALDTAPVSADRHIRYTGTNNAFPFGYQPLDDALFAWATVWRTVHFTGTAVGGSPPFRFAWSFGDGATGEGNPYSHYYMTNGTFSVVMTASNILGFAWASATGDVVVDAPLPVATIYLPLVPRGQ